GFFTVVWRGRSNGRDKCHCSAPESCCQDTRERKAPMDRRRRLFHPVVCGRCAALVDFPRWRLIAWRTYAPFCLTCLAERSATFTPTDAIVQARAIIAAHHLQLRGATP